MRAITTFFSALLVCSTAAAEVDCRELLATMPKVVNEDNSLVLTAIDNNGKEIREILAKTTFFTKVVDADTVVTAFHHDNGERKYTQLLLWKRRLDKFEVAFAPVITSRLSTTLIISTSAKFYASLLEGESSGRKWIEVQLVPMTGGMIHNWSINDLGLGQLQKANLSDEGALEFTFEVNGQRVLKSQIYKFEK